MRARARIDVVAPRSTSVFLNACTFFFFFFFFFERLPMRVRVRVRVGVQLPGGGFKSLAKRLYKRVCPERGKEEI